MFATRTSTDALEYPRPKAGEAAPSAADAASGARGAVEDDYANDYNYDGGYDEDYPAARADDGTACCTDCLTGRQWPCWCCAWR